MTEYLGGMVDQLIDAMTFSGENAGNIFAFGLTMTLGFLVYIWAVMLAVKDEEAPLPDLDALLVLERRRCGHDRVLASRLRVRLLLGLHRLWHCSSHLGWSGDLVSHQRRSRRA